MKRYSDLHPAEFSAIIIFILIGVIFLSAQFGARSQTVTNPAPFAMACAYNASPPAATDATFVYVQCDSSGLLIIAP